MSIQLTPLEMIQALRFGYHRKNRDSFVPIEEQEISEEQAEIVLTDKICSIIEGLNLPIVVLVSGGVDSSLIFQMTKKCFESKNIKTIGMNYPQADYNFEPVNDWIMDTLSKINSYTYQNLFFSSSLICTQKMYSFAKNLGPAILTGDGGDELFCGYDKYLLPNISWAKGKSRRQLKSISYFNLGYEGAMTTPIDLNLFRIDYPKTLKDRMLYDIAQELKYIEIPKVETAQRMSHTEGIIHSPFLNKKVFDFCLSLPMRYKFKFGIRKVLLRKILKRQYIKIPHRKSGFAFPTEWIGNELNWSLTVLNKLMSKGMVEIISDSK